MKWDIEKFVVIIHGDIRADISLIENCWKGYNIIWSTWNNESISTDKKVIYNEIPKDSGVQNLMYQKVCIYNGLLEAKELGYERAIKWRTDQYLTNTKDFISILDPYSTNVLFWHNYQGGYYVDYFMEGNITDLLLIWNLDSYDYPYSEYATTKQILKNKIKINCIGKYITEKNDIIWVNRNPDKKLSSYNLDPTFQTVNIN